MHNTGERTQCALHEASLHKETDVIMFVDCCPVLKTAKSSSGFINWYLMVMYVKNTFQEKVLL